MTTLDAPSAVAASLCWLARWRGLGRQYAAPATARHPRECGWCAYPPQTLIDWIEEFNDADLIRDDRTGALLFDPAGQPLHRIGGEFHRLPRVQQRSLVDRAMYPEAVPA